MLQVKSTNTTFFSDWSVARGKSKKLPEMNDEELDSTLRQCYAKARSTKGKTTILRYGIERYLNSPPYDRGIKIIKESEVCTPTKC